MTDPAPVPVQLWRLGPLVCVVVHHWQARTYEIRVMNEDQMVERRWFLTSEEAAEFASARLRALPEPSF